MTKCWLKSFDLNKMIAKVVQKIRLHKLVGVVESLVTKRSTKIKRNGMWHQTFGQFFMHALTTLDQNNLVEGMDLNRDRDLSFCIDVCMFNTIIPHFGKGNSWAYRHIPMWYHGNNPWRGKLLHTC